jgi:hypothetical protein
MDRLAGTLAWIDELHGAGGPPLTIGALGVSVMLLLALVLLAVRNRRLQMALATQAAGGESTFGSAAAPPAGPHAETVRTPIDRVLLGHPAAFYSLALSISVACWAVGLVLAPSKPRFLQSSEWHVQPFYLAAHLIALRLFVQLFVRKYAAGAAHLDIAPEKVANGIRRALGPQAWLAAAAIALPFSILDYRYLMSDRYEKLSEDQQLYAIDYLMWGIWCTEWLLNALIWVTLVGFLAMGYRALRSCRFRAPIATVVQERLYRPFLQMSSQGATIVLGFACITGFYIWYAGGAISDFLGLGVTGVLLVAGFVPLWLQLNAKVRRSIGEEIEALRRNLPSPLTGASVLAANAGAARTVEQRLDEVVALMRAWHLERLQLDLGRVEAQALAVRLAAPAATAGWQLYSNLQGILGHIGGAIRSILSAFARLFM